MHMRAAKSLQGARDRMLNKHTPTLAGLIRTFHTFSADRPVYWMYPPALECDTNFSLPVALFVDDADSD